MGPIPTSLSEPLRALKEARTVTRQLKVETTGWPTIKESVSEMGIGNNNKKLYTVLSYLGVFTFHTCCKIQICLVCIGASLRLSCV